MDKNDKLLAERILSVLVELYAKHCGVKIDYEIVDKGDGPDVLHG